MKTKNIGEVRIIAGMHKGKRLTVPKTNKTRPTADRVRESMFNILEHNDWGLKDKSILIGANVLDIFSGSGAAEEASVVKVSLRVRVCFKLY